jgi:hypothetical protein
MIAYINVNLIDSFFNVNLIVRFFALLIYLFS